MHILFRYLLYYLNLALVDARYVRTTDNSIRNKRVEQAPPVLFRTGIAYARGPFRTAFNYAYTARHFTDATNAIRTASAVNGEIPAYAIADWSASWRWRRFTVEVNCNNILDSRYFTRRAEAYPGPGIVPADGRSWGVTVETRL